MNNKILVTLILTLLMPAAAFAQTKRKPPRRTRTITRTGVVPVRPNAEPPTVVMRADMSGRLDGSIYTNNLLGVRVTLPAGWQASDPEVKRQIEKRVEQNFGELAQDKSTSTQREMRASIQRTSQLLLATKPTDDATNPVILVMSEDISVLSLVSSAKQYAAMLVRAANTLDAPMVFDTEVESERIGNTEYAVVRARPRDAQIASPGVEQRYYITARRNHALAFVLTFAGPEQRQACRDVLEAIEYR